MSNQSIEKIMQYTCYLVIALVVYFLCISFIQPGLMHHVQQVGFYTDRQFLNGFMHEPGGIASLAALSLTQFFSGETVAGLCISGLLLIQILFFRQVLMKITADPLVYFPLSLIPSLLMLPLLHDYCFQYAVIMGWLIATICLWLVASLREKPFIVPLIIILGIMLFHLAESGPFTLFIAGSVVVLLFRKNWKRILLEIPVLLLYWYLLPIFLSHFIYNLSPEERYTRFLDDVPVMLLYKPERLFYLAIGSVPALILLAQGYEHSRGLKACFEKWMNTGLKRNGFILLSALLITAAYFWLINRYNRPEEKMLARIDYDTYHGHWEESTRECLHYKEFNIFANFNYNLSCMGLNQLPERFFDYPQMMGEQSMFPDKINSGQIANICSDFYYNLGYVSEARHWAYEAQTLLPYSPRVLKRLLLTNLIYGNYPAANTCLTILLSSPVEKKWAEKYAAYLTDTLLTYADSEIAFKRRQMPLDVIAYKSMDEKYEQLMERDSTNALAYQCMQLHALLGHRLSNFVLNYLRYGKSFNTTLPDVFGEAYMVFLVRSKVHDMAGPAVSSGVQQKFSGFTNILKKYKGDKEKARDELYALYGNTYWYYMIFDSPLVTHATVATREVDY